MRTDGIHCRQAACVGSVILMVDVVRGAVFLGVTMN